MKKLLICALALGGFAASAQAADLSVDNLKDPLPEKISFAGVTVYGTVDVGYAYQTNGLPESGAFYTGLNWSNQKLSKGAISTLTNSAMEQSKVGVKVEEALGMGFVALGKLETGFNPLSGEIADACASMVRVEGYSLAGRNSLAAYSDGGRCGQILNGDAYAGLSNSSYGTLTIGRQSSLVNEGIGTYDPNHGSYAFSLIGYSGGALGGIGSTETSRWDNSVKYVYQFGPLHGAVMYSNGGQDTSLFGDAVGGNIGGNYKGLSIDVYYEKENGAVALSPSATTNTLAGTITDNEAWVIMGKYTYDLGGGLKDEGPSSKVSFFGGYAHIDMSNPSHSQGYYNNFNTIGGYLVTTAGGFGVIGSTKTLQTSWAGATYETGPWSFTGAYYHEGQNSYLAMSSTTGALTGCTHTTTTTTVNGVARPTAINASSNCSGDINFGSLVVDYRFNKHFDVYAGVSSDGIDGGLGSGYLSNNNTNVVTGLRLKF